MYGDLMKKFIIRFSYLLIFIGLLLLIGGSIYFYNSKTVDPNTETQYVENSSSSINLDSITSSDGVVTIDKTNIKFSDEFLISEYTLPISTNKDIDDLYLKVSFYFEEGDITIPVVLHGMKKGEVIKQFEQTKADLTVTKSWSVEVTTLEDLENNYGYTITD